MKVLAHSPEMSYLDDPLEALIFTDPSATHNMQELVEEGKCVSDGWLLTEDLKHDDSDEIVEKLYIKVGDTVYATISSSFIRGFKRLLCNADMPITRKTLNEFNCYFKATKNGRKCLLFGAISFREVQ